MIMCSMVGLLTPPVGMVLFATSSIAKISVGRLSRALDASLDWSFRGVDGRRHDSSDIDMAA